MNAEQFQSLLASVAKRAAIPEGRYVPIAPLQSRLLDAALKWQGSNWRRFKRELRKAAKEAE